MGDLSKISHKDLLTIFLSAFLLGVIGLIALSIGNVREPSSRASSYSNNYNAIKNDGYLEYGNDNGPYPPDTGPISDCEVKANSNYVVGQTGLGFMGNQTGYVDFRGYLDFSTVDIPVDATVTSASLSLTETWENGNYFTLEVRRLNWGGVLNCANWGGVFPIASVVGAFNLSSLGLNGGRFNIPINPAGITKGGVTYFMLTDNHETANPPTSTIGELAFIISAISASNPSNSPQLSVSYTGSPSPAPTADIKANGSNGPITIPYNSAATISWSSVNATSCSVSPTGWGGTSNGGISTGNLTSSRTYTLSCTGAGGTSPPDSVVVNVSSLGGGGGGGSSGGSGGKPGVTGGSGSTTGNLETINLEIPIPYLVGITKIKLEMSSVSKEIQVSPQSKSYSWDVRGATLPLKKEYKLIVTSGSTLVRKITFTPTQTTINLNTGDLTLGDVNQDNTIDSKDQLLLLGSIADQSTKGDINLDKATNSFDWAILLTNLGEKGD